MKAIPQIIGIVVIAFSLSACKTTSDMHNSRNSLDWEGTYKSIGKENVSVVNLQKDLNYSMQTAPVGDLAKVSESSGTFSWNKAGSEIVLHDTKTGTKSTFMVGENNLLNVAKDGKKLTPDTQFAMVKIPTDGITDKYWKLIELNGKPIVVGESRGREPHILLESKNTHMTGTGGCNVFNGPYELGAMGKIRFTKIASTLMACMDMATEAGMMKMLEEVDNYTVSADGKNLSLNKARMAPLARFEVVYLK